MTFDSPRDLLSTCPKYREQEVTVKYSEGGGRNAGVTRGKEMQAEGHRREQWLTGAGVNGVAIDSPLPTRLPPREGRGGR
jgi:hypothetical protein